MGKVAGKLVPFLLRGASAALIFSALTVYYQDYLVVPLALNTSHTLEPRDPASLRHELKSDFIEAADGVKIEIWSSGKAISKAKSRGIALFFAGNAQPIEQISNLSLWFHSIGLKSYFLSYRGTGRSSGSVSEQGIYKDAEALWKFATENGVIPAEQVFVFSHSLGSGPASYIAQRHSPAALVLFSPFTSLRDVVSEMPLYGLLLPFLRWHFPVSDRIADLPQTCVVLAHGARDDIVPIEHSRKIAAQYHGVRSITFLEDSEKSHNDILSVALLHRVTKTLSECVP